MKSSEPSRFIPSLPSLRQGGDHSESFLVRLLPNFDESQSMAASSGHRRWNPTIRLHQFRSQLRQWIRWLTEFILDKITISTVNNGDYFGVSINRKSLKQLPYYSVEEHVHAWAGLLVSYHCRKLMSWRRVDCSSGKLKRHGLCWRLVQRNKPSPSVVCLINAILIPNRPDFVTHISIFAIFRENDFEHEVESLAKFIILNQKWQDLCHLYL